MDKIIFAILYFTGASSIEELSESEIERFETLSNHPIAINLCPESRLEESGLLSSYQCASLLDYISSGGDILSLKELSSVDGFSPELCRALEPFISFESLSTAGRNSRNKKVKNEMTARSVYRYRPPSSEFVLSGKYRISKENKWSFSAASKGEEWSLSAAIYGRKWLRKVIIGDYNARFGEGLSVWSGFDIKNPTCVDGFEKKACGLSPVWTWSPSTVKRGAALSLGLGKSALDLAYECGGTAMGRLSYVMRKSEFGAVGCVGEDSGFSLYSRTMFGYLKFWSEAAYDSKQRQLKALAGIMSKGGEWKWALLGGVNPLKFSAGLGHGPMNVVGWVSQEDSRLSARWEFKPVESLSLVPRLCYKRTNGDYARLEARFDAKYDAVRFDASTRADYVRKLKGAWHFSLEGGLKGAKGNCHLRFAAFRVDNWDDRIYVYERDLPLSFSVPAYYGKGMTVSLVSNLKFRRSRLGCRFSWFGYEDKPDKTEFKLQYSLTL